VATFGNSLSPKPTLSCAPLHGGAMTANKKPSLYVDPHAERERISQE
jgi:hypothetical protein